MTSTLGVTAWLDAYAADDGRAGRVIVDSIEVVLRGPAGERVVTSDAFDMRWAGDRAWGEWLDASAAGWGRTLASAEADLRLASGQVTIDPSLAPPSVPRPCFGEVWDRHWPRAALGPVSPGDVLVVRARVLAEGAAHARVGLDVWAGTDRSDWNVEAAFSAPVGASSGWTWLEAQVAVHTVY